MRNTLLILGFFLIFSSSVHAQGKAPFIETSTSATGRNQVTIQSQSSEVLPAEVILANFIKQASIILKREENIAARIQTRSRKIEKSGVDLGDFADKELQLNDAIAKAGVSLSELSAPLIPISSYSADEYTAYKGRLYVLVDTLQNILKQEKQLLLVLRAVSQPVTREGISR